MVEESIRKVIEVIIDTNMDHFMESPFPGWEREDRLYSMQLNGKITSKLTESILLE